LAQHLRQPPAMPVPIALQAEAMEELRRTRSAIEKLAPVLETLAQRLQAPDVAAIETATRRAAESAQVIEAASTLWQPLTDSLDRIEQRQTRHLRAIWLILACAFLTLCASAWTLWRASSPRDESEQRAARQLDWQRDTTARLERLEARPAPTIAPPARPRP
jgi:hypothetical protein